MDWSTDMVRLQAYGSLTRGQDPVKPADPANQSIQYVDIIEPYSEPMSPLAPTPCSMMRSWNATFPLVPFSRTRADRNARRRFSRRN